MIRTLLAGAALAAAVPLAAQEVTIEPAGLAGPLAGTLLRASDPGAPAALIIPGSGPTDRDGNSPLGITAASYRLLAEGLAAKGVTTLRIDKRGMFGSAAAIPDPNAVTVAAYSGDVLDWAAKLRVLSGRPCVWLIGHSEGGLAALAAAARKQDGICGVVALAAPGRPLGTILREQLRANPANAPILPQADAAIAALEKGEHVDAAGLDPALLGLFGAQLQDYLIDLFAIDPARLAASQNLPLLILAGEADAQVSPADAAALATARPDAAKVTLPGVNHVLKQVPTGDQAANAAAYANPDLPIAPAVPKAIADFIANPPRPGWATSPG